MQRLSSTVLLRTCATMGRSHRGILLSYLVGGFPRPSWFEWRRSFGGVAPSPPPKGAGSKRGGGGKKSSALENLRGAMGGK